MKKQKNQTEKKLSLKKLQMAKINGLNFIKGGSIINGGLGGGGNDTVDRTQTSINCQKGQTLQP